MVRRERQEKWQQQINLDSKPSHKQQERNMHKKTSSKLNKAMCRLMDNTLAQLTPHLPPKLDTPKLDPLKADPRQKSRCSSTTRLAE